MKAISFKGFNLQANPFKVVREQGLFDSPYSDINSFELARSDNAVAVYRRFGSRKFSLSGNIQSDSAANLEASIDALKLALVKQQGDLGVEWAGTTRYFNAECQNVAIARANTDVDRCGWSASFFMAVPYSSDNTQHDFFTDIAGFTAGSQQIGVNNVGTYLAYPFITLTLTAIDPNITDVSFTISNPSSNESITITDEFADGDIITIDTFNRQIFRGSELLAGVGLFPAWLPGSGLLNISDTATSRTYNLEAHYIGRFL